MIIIVEDNPVMRSNLQRLLQMMHLPYLCFASAEETLTHLNGLDDDTPALLLCDIRLPGMNGIDLSEELRQRFPAMQVIYFSEGFSPAPPDDSVFFPKPFRLDRMRQTILESLPN